MRFQKRIKILPGVTANLSRKGVSTSLGVTGARVTYGHGEKRTTVGLPGTGISHSEIERITPPTEHEAQPPGDTKNLLIGVGFIVFLFLIAWMISALF